METGERVNMGLRRLVKPLIRQRVVSQSHTRHLPVFLSSCHLVPPPFFPPSLVDLVS